MAIQATNRDTGDEFIFCTEIQSKVEALMIQMGCSDYILGLVECPCSCHCGGFERGELCKQPCDICDEEGLVWQSKKIN